MGCDGEPTETKQQDISQEEQLDQMQTMMDSLAHDLRNPLAVAQQYISLARTSQDEDHFDRVENSLERISDLIETRLESTHERRSEQVAAETFFDTHVKRAWGCVETPNATLHVELDEPPLAIHAEDSHICSILENLFRNAIEHGGSTVTVTVGELSDARGFYVADNGPGIPASARSKIFDDGVSSGDGPGLGLSIVEMLSGLYGWEIRVTNSASDGARFEFEIPEQR